MFIMTAVAFKNMDNTCIYIENLYKNAYREVIVAVIDTGIDINEFENTDRIKVVTSDVIDEFGHGTEIASLILYNTTENIKIMPIKVADNNGTASMKDLCNGIQMAVENGANIINISMNTAFYTDTTELQQLIDELKKNGVYVIVSAGNDNEDAKYLAPANIDSAIVVGAVAEDDTPYYFSNYGESVDISALGLYDGKLGTSFAAAYVTSFCAQAMAGGFNDIESILNWCTKPIIDTNMGVGILEWPEQYTGNNNNLSELYVSTRNKTQNEKTFNILNIDWQSMSQKELDAIIGETDYKYVGLFLSKLTCEELEELKEKSHILNTKVNVIGTKYNKTTGDYVTNQQFEFDFINYCLDAYKTEADKYFITSDWDCRTTEAIFYLSSPDRQKIYKYTITGLYGKAWVVDSGWQPAFTDADLSLVSSVYKDNATAFSFTRPTPIRLSTYTPSVRATRVDTYKADGTFVGTGYNWMCTGNGFDDGMRYVGISIEFNNYTNKATGYHNSEHVISMYNAGSGIGSSIEEALTFAYDYGSTSYPQISNVRFDKTARGYVECYYDCEFKSGYDMYNATTFEESISSYRFGVVDNIYVSTGESSINDTSGSFTINAVPHIGFGTKWYGTSNNVLYVESHVPEIVFNLAPNNYTIVFNGNGATSGSTASKTMTYDIGDALTANGFSRTGYSFAGWNTKADGTGTSYIDKNWVANLTSVNGGVVTLYAQWKPLNYTMTLNHNGGAYGNDASNAYTVTIGTSNYYCVAGVLPTRVGYTFNGYWDGNVQVYNEAGYCTNEGTFWLNNTWQFYYDATFYAQWVPATYKQIVQVRYENADGTFTAYENVIDTNYVYGSTVSWSRPADATYQAASITTYTVTEAKNTKVTVYRKQFQVTLAAGTGISAVSGADSYRVGQSVTIDATVSTGYTWKDWIGTFTETTKNYTFTMPSSNVTLTAYAHDITAPTITLSQSPTAWTNGNVTLKAIASDAGVGLHDTPFSWDNGTTWVTSDTSIAVKNGTYSVKVRDKAGNTATASITVTNIDKLSPNIDGLEDFATISEIDRNEGKQTVTVTLTDPSNTDYGASGIKGGTLTVTNSDNNLSKTWTIDSTGIIEIDITNKEYSELFYGNFKVTVEAEDNVGNKSTKAFDITEFTLDTELIHADNYKSSLFIKGETGLFIFYAGGYPDEVRVYFPLDAGLDQDYSATFYYTKQKAVEIGQIPFYVPLDAIEGDYTIYVESYKNGKPLQTKSQAFQITEETILDRLQTQLSR